MNELCPLTVWSLVLLKSVMYEFFGILKTTKLGKT